MCFHPHIQLAIMRPTTPITIEQKMILRRLARKPTRRYVKLQEKMSPTKNGIISNFIFARDINLLEKKVSLF
jgi:hypothetical protein